MIPTNADPAPSSQPDKNWFGVTSAEIDHLFRFNADSSTFNKVILFFVGIFLTPITLAGSLIGYARAYDRFMKPLAEYPLLHPLRPIVRFAMFAAIAKSLQHVSINP